MSFIQELKERSQTTNRKIVFPEGNDPRILRAARIVKDQEIATPIILGKKKELWAINVDPIKGISDFLIVDPAESEEYEEFYHKYYEMRKDKGVSLEKAKDLLKDPLYFSAMMVKNGFADGSVAGAANTTANVLRPALQIIGTASGVSVVSGTFIMLIDTPHVPRDMLIFADCAVNPQPDAQQLAEIAVSSARTARSITGLNPSVALLSFSTKGSAQHPLIDKVVEACRIARKMEPDIGIDGELQADAAIVPNIGERKAPNSKVAGKANVLIFPDLQSANISYKLVERLANITVIGPILQGMEKPVNDLSRGCSVEDIVNLTAITVLQADQVSQSSSGKTKEKSEVPDQVESKS